MAATETDRRAQVTPGRIADWQYAARELMLDMQRAGVCTPRTDLAFQLLAERLRELSGR